MHLGLYTFGTSPPMPGAPNSAMILWGPSDAGSGPCGFSSCQAGQALSRLFLARRRRSPLIDLDSRDLHVRFVEPVLVIWAENRRAGLLVWALALALERLQFQSRQWFRIWRHCAKLTRIMLRSAITGQAICSLHLLALHQFWI